MKRALPANNRNGQRKINERGSRPGFKGIRSPIGRRIAAVKDTAACKAIFESCGRFKPFDTFRRDSSHFSSTQQKWALFPNEAPFAKVPQKCARARHRMPPLQRVCYNS